ncbi:hypothetical protein ADL02_28955 [Streptomyces sp. NRRL WC-3723]|nr:hypothetical protein ADL02_28955 [Streptomyces sp. NRRL WC-3723]
MTGVSPIRPGNAAPQKGFGRPPGVVRSISAIVSAVAHTFRSGNRSRTGAVAHQWSPCACVT